MIKQPEIKDELYKITELDSAINDVEEERFYKLMEKGD